MEKNTYPELYIAINEKVFDLKKEVAESKNTIESTNTSEADELILAQEEVISLIETKVKEYSDPLKMVKWIVHIKSVSKKCRDKAILSNNNFEKQKFQLVIDNIIDPLINSCLDVMINMVDTNSNVTSDATGQFEQNQTKGVAAKKQFQQINCNATKEQIEYFFMILATEINPSTGKPYIKKEDVIKFIENNFTVFGKPYVSQYFEINTEIKSTITYFIFQFYQKYDHNNINSKMKYVYLLIENFKQFSNDNPISLRSNMTPSKISKDKNNIIDTEKYFPKNK